MSERLVPVIFADFNTKVGYQEMWNYKIRENNFYRELGNGLMLTAFGEIFRDERKLVSRITPLQGNILNLLLDFSPHHITIVQIYNSLGMDLRYGGLDVPWHIFTIKNKLKDIDINLAYKIKHRYPKSYYWE